jgi:hypothetical protein
MRVNRRRWHALGSVFLASIGILASAAQASPSSAEPGAWKEQELSFDFMGFTDHYTCSGLQEKMRLVLRELGARSDLRVFEPSCLDQSLRTHPIPSVRMQFASLVPGPGAQAGAGTNAGTSAAPVAGAWKRVDLVGAGKLDKDECELVEQIVSDLLPHFAVRNVQRPANCVPHTRTLTALQLEVFAPLPQPAN